MGTMYQDAQGKMDYGSAAKAPEKIAGVNFERRRILTAIMTKKKLKKMGRGESKEFV
jgi:hypothetical protein